MHSLLPAHAGVILAAIISSFRRETAPRTRGGDPLTEVQRRLNHDFGTLTLFFCIVLAIVFFLGIRKIKGTGGDKESDMAVNNHKIFKTYGIACGVLACAIIAFSITAAVGQTGLPESDQDSAYAANVGSQTENYDDGEAAPATTAAATIAPQTAAPAVVVPATAAPATAAPATAAPATTAAAGDFSAFLGNWRWTDKNDSSIYSEITITSVSGAPAVDIGVYEGIHSASIPGGPVKGTMKDGKMYFSFTDSYGSDGSGIISFAHNSLELQFLKSGSEISPAAGTYTYYTAAAEEQSDYDIYINEKLLPDSASKYYTKDEVIARAAIWTDQGGYTMSQALRLARNEIFANHGTTFKDEKLNEYFYSERGELYGYGGDISAEEANGEFNDYERENVSTVKAAEADYK